MTVAVGRAARAFGLCAEMVATLWLRFDLSRALVRQHRANGGEVGVVEVKSRGSMDDAEIEIAPLKLRRRSVASRHWLTRHPEAAQFALRADAF